MGRLITVTANCGVLGDWAKSQGRFYSYNTEPHYGDLVLFDFSGNHKTRQHVGIIVGGNGSTLQTVEGNTSVTSNDNGGAVMLRTRYRSQVVGYIRPAYNTEQTASRLVEIAKSQIGAKESPANSNNVKYNTWYYGKAVSGSAYPWCCVFVEWCFAVLAGDIKINIGGEKVTVTLNVLSVGSTGPQVKTIQRILYARGIKGADGKEIAVDGEYGNNTYYAVKRLQSQLGLSQTGTVNADTWTRALTALN